MFDCPKTVPLRRDSRSTGTESAQKTRRRSRARGRFLSVLRPSSRARDSDQTRSAFVATQSHRDALRHAAPNHAADAVLRKSCWMRGTLRGGAGGLQRLHDLLDPLGDFFLPRPCAVNLTTPTARLVPPSVVRDARRAARRVLRGPSRPAWLFTTIGMTRRGNVSV